MIRRFGLSLLLIFAGFIHLIQPGLFLRALPDYLPLKIELILISGVFEILLGIGLLTKKFQNFTARLTALYLFLLIPIHIYVSCNGIEMFGITNPIWLWLRTAFQWPLIYMALSLQTTGWIIQQSWRHVLFLHYKINPDLIAHMVPFKLDLHEGEAVISIVPLLMNKIRFPYLPSIPWISQLWELNIRTYVEVNGIKGVYFFTLETDSRLGEYIAQTFFNLPYRYSKIKSTVSTSNYSITHSRGDIFSNLKVKTGQTKQFCTFDFWATERYSLFTTKNDSIYRGIVMHRPWELKSVVIEEINENLSNQFNLKEMRFVGASYSEGLDVKFRPFIKMTELNKI